jgi:hypothetical protein
VVGISKQFSQPSATVIHIALRSVFRALALELFFLNSCQSQRKRCVKSCACKRRK